MAGINEYISKFKNKRILIQGLGLNGGGVGTAKFFLENNINVIITDMKSGLDLEKSINELKEYEHKIKYVLGGHNESDFIEADIVVKGPGVPPTNKFIKIAAENGSEIISDIEIFMNVTPCPVFAVTGSKGKSSTVSAIYNIFKTSTPNSFIGGNITISPLSFYKQLDEHSLVILELSSWQLRDIKGKKIKFKGTGITNLLNDHQNYYTNMKDYLDDKAIIAENLSPDEFLILPDNDKMLNTGNIKTNASIYHISKNAVDAALHFENGKAVFMEYGKSTVLFENDDIQLPGEHSRYNMLFAAGFCLLAGIKPEIIKEGIRSFKGTPYRLETVRVWNGIRFVNDTTATIPDAAANAIKAFNEPVIWISHASPKCSRSRNIFCF